MRIVVTGAGGFVGRFLVPRLLDEGHEVFGLSPDETAPRGARALRGDVRDAHVVERHLESVSPDAVVHLAAVAFVPEAQRRPLLAGEVNAQGTLVLLHAVERCAPRAVVLVVSSAEVYGPVRDPSRMPLAEDEPMRPASVYGASKAAAEHYARAFAARGLDVRVLRPFNHVGPGQDPNYVVASFARQVARIEAGLDAPPLRHGNLDAVRDFTDVRDVVAAYAAALCAPHGRLVPGEPYNVCSGRGVRVGEVLEGLLRLARKPVATETDPSRLRAVEVPVFVGSPRRLREALAWEAKIPLERTLADVLDDARRTLES